MQGAANLVPINVLLVSKATSSAYEGVNLITDNATSTRNANIVSINSTAAAAAALSFLTNDTNNLAKVSSQINGVALVTAPPTSGTMTLTTTTTNLTNNTPTAGTITLVQSGTVNQVLSVPALTAGTITLVQSGTINSVLNVPALTAGTVTLAASQPLYAPAKAGDGMNITAINSSASAAAALSFATVDTNGDGVKRLAVSVSGISYTTTEEGAKGLWSVGADYNPITGNGYLDTMVLIDNATSVRNVTAIRINTSAGAFTAASVVASSGTLTLNGGIVGNLSGSVGSLTGYVAPDNANITNTLTQATTAATNTTQLPNMITGTGTAAKYTGTALVNAPTGGGGGGFTGSQSVTLTFHDAASQNVAGAIFLVHGVGTGYADANGTITIGLNNGTYTVTTTPTSSTLFPDTTLTVSGATSLTITGTAITYTPAGTPDQSRVYLVCYDPQGNVDPTAKVTFQQTAAGTVGLSSYTPITCSCDSSGRVLDPVDGAPGVILMQALHRYWRGTISATSPKKDFTPSTDPYTLPPSIG